MGISYSSQGFRWPFGTVWRRLGSNMTLDGPAAKILGVEGEHCQIQHEAMENKAKRHLFRFRVCLLVWSKNCVCPFFSAFWPIDPAFAPGNGGERGETRPGTGGKRGRERGGNGNGGNGNGDTGGERGRMGGFRGLAWGSAVLEATVPKSKRLGKFIVRPQLHEKIFKLP